MQEGYENQHSYCFLLRVATITNVLRLLQRRDLRFSQRSC